MVTEVFEVSSGQWAYRVDGVYQDWHPGKPGFVAMTEAEAQTLAALVPVGPTEPPPRRSVTRAQAKSALLLSGLLDYVQPAIDSIPDPLQRRLAQIDWDERLGFELDNPTLVALAAGLGLGPGDLSALFDLAETR